MTVTIIDYGSGNLRSAAKAFERAAREHGLDEDIHVTADADLVAKADHIVLPGVGAFADCKAGLLGVDGMVDALTEAVHGKGRPFLGICVGMQLLSTVGREFGDTPGLGWIDGEVVKLNPDDAALKIPHMGWNELHVPEAHTPVLDGISSRDHAYFVHSYHFLPKDPAHLAATVGYGGTVTAVVAKDNMVGTQFHPEKSQVTGQKLITNFLSWKP
jgi:glutamine amidotransferase